MKKIIATNEAKDAVVYSPPIFGTELPSNKDMRTHDLPADYRFVWATPVGKGNWIVGNDALNQSKL